MNRLDNFKGKMHVLTLEDRKKGGKVSSKKKALANGTQRLEAWQEFKQSHTIAKMQ